LYEFSRGLEHRGDDILCCFHRFKLVGYMFSIVYLGFIFNIVARQFVVKSYRYSVYSTTLTTMFSFSISCPTSKIASTLAPAVWFAVVKSCNATSIIFSARQHICYSALYAIARPSVCSSHVWISQKRLKSGSWNFHHRVAP